MKIFNIAFLVLVLSTTFSGLALGQIAYQDLTAEEFHAKMSNANTIILDLRTDEEIAGGMIDGAIQIDYRASDFDSKIDQLDKTKEYLVYCAAATRSPKGCTIMYNKGFTNLGNLLGGYDEWPY